MKGIHFERAGAGLRENGPGGRRECRPAESGVALVVTLILLAVITFMAIAFLVLSHREQSSVTTTTDQAIARNGADAGTERAIADLAVSIVTSGNPYKVGYTVSTTYENPLAFSQNPTVPNPTNVNYDIAAQRGFQLVNLRNLLYTPRPPVFIRTNTLGSNEFRFYLDLNRNTVFDSSGLVTNIGLNGQVLVDTNGNRPLLSYEVGDPQWVGGLEFPDKAHSPDNRFIWRYAYAVVPISDTLDINYIHNQAVQPGAAGRLDLTYGKYYLRNQGVGTWEINLAAFLFDLNTNGWGPQYTYQPPMQSGQPLVEIGNGFPDACSILDNRYGNLAYEKALAPVTALFALPGRTAFISDNVDGYTQGPVMTNLVYRSDPDFTKAAQPWLGADNTNHFLSPQDLFDPLKTSSHFATVLLSAGRKTNTYDRYLFSRLVEQLGTDSAPEPAGKINLNYDNLVATNALGIVSSTNFIPWQPEPFFTNTANKLLADAGYKFSVTNIQVWPTNYYTPGVHRLMQLTANIFDSTTNRLFASATGARALPACPTVFRPLFRRLNDGRIVIAGYREVQQAQQSQWISPTAAPFVIDYQTLGTNNQQGTIPAYGQAPNNNERLEPMISGIPLVIGAKKGLPNFNELAMQTHLYVSRFLEFRRDPAQPASTSPIVQTNQMYVVSLTNNFGLEAWNPYTNSYPRGLQLISSLEMTAIMTNELGTQVLTNKVFRGINTPITANTWRGWNANPGISFVLPWSTTNVFAYLTNSTYTNGFPWFVRQTHEFQRNSGFYTPQWVLNLNTKLKFILYDTEAQRIIDYVNVDNSERALDVFSKLREGYDRGNLVNYTNAGNLWLTNRAPRQNNPTYGIINQISACLNGDDAIWKSMSMDPVVGQDAHKAVDFFRVNMGLTTLFNTGNVTKSNIFYAPFSPYRPIYIHTTWQANDPLVHYTVGDLVDQSIDETNRVDFQPRNPPLDNLGVINNRYEPWGGNPAGFRSNPDIPQYQMAAKDPMVQRPDDWDFPTNKYPNVGWLGRVHRGTPWQTVFLKSTNVLFQGGVNQQGFYKSLDAWQKWTGNKQTYPTNGMEARVDTNNPVVLDAIRSGRVNSAVVDAMFSVPTNDWRLMDLFTTAFNDNASRGRLSVNQTNLAAWSAVLSGVNVLTDAKNSAFIEPAGIYNPVQPPPLLRVVQGINATRARTPTGSFQRLGDILATPELTMASPYITNTASISDAVVERIPQQVMGLLRGGEPPRFLIYTYGQALKPAPRSVQTSGQFPGLCTNYTITAEVATRTVVRFEGAPKNPRAIVESFNVLPPD